MLIYILPLTLEFSICGKLNKPDTTKRFPHISIFIFSHNVDKHRKINKFTGYSSTFLKQTSAIGRDVETKRY